MDGGRRPARAPDAIATPAAQAVIGVSVGALGQFDSDRAGELNACLATTPGGLDAVLATATRSRADATFVLAVQVLRLFVMLFSAALLARILRARAA